MGLLSLSMDIFRILIIEPVVLDMSLYQAVKLRTVCSKSEALSLSWKVLREAEY